MLFCDLCHKYLPRIDQDKDIQSLLEEHCLSAGHLNAYDKNEKNQLDDTSKKSTETENNQKVKVRTFFDLFRPYFSKFSGSPSLIFIPVSLCYSLFKTNRTVPTKNNLILKRKTQLVPQTHRLLSKKLRLHKLYSMYYAR